MCMLRFYYIIMESPIRIFMQLCKHHSRWLETELPLGSECCIRQWHSWLPPSRSDSCLLTYLCCLMYFLTDDEMLQSCICLLQSFPFVCYQQAQTCSILHCQLCIGPLHIESQDTFDFFITAFLVILVNECSLDFLKNYSS